MIRLCTAAIVVSSLLAEGCTVGPDYRRPILAVPTAWQARQPHDGKAQELSLWWSRFGDAVLSSLQSAAEANSPTLDEAVARIVQARATLTSSRADALPSVTAQAGYETVKSLNGSSQQTFQTAISGLQGELDASWEIDLFGKVRRSNEAARARIAARIDDWHDARTTLAAEVADDYARFRGCQRMADIYQGQAISQQETARLTRINANAGYSAPADADLAEGAAAMARSSYLKQVGECDLLLKSLTSLTALDEPTLRVMLAPGEGVLPTTPAFAVSSVPADLLRQRPDIGSRERELAAASAEIGVAVADLYPSLELGGILSLNRLVKQWTFGPALSLPIFDGGRRRAAVTSARAAYDRNLAGYRLTVRDAVQEVEEALVRLDTARSRAGQAENAIESYGRHLDAMEHAYLAGRASMLDRETARRNLLEARLSAADLRLTEVRSWIALYKALGGGWKEGLGQSATK